MTPLFLFAEAGDPCRPCRGTGTEATYDGHVTSCYHCGGTGTKSIRAAGTDLLKNTYTEGYSAPAEIAGSCGQWTVDDMAYVNAMNNGGPA